MASDTGFLGWLRQQEEKEMSALMVQADPTQIYRTQGKLQFIQTMRKNLESARIARSG